MNHSLRLCSWRASNDSQYPRAVGFQRSGSGQLVSSVELRVSAFANPLRPPDEASLFPIDACSALCACAPHPRGPRKCVSTFVGAAVKITNMMIKKKDRRKEVDTRNWKVFDYPLRLQATGIAYQVLNGRTPKTGDFRNNVCTEIFYIIGGTGIIGVKNRTYTLHKGDVYIAKPKERYYLVGKNLEFLTITSPNWYREQCETLPD